MFPVDVRYPEKAGWSCPGRPPKLDLPVADAVRHPRGDRPLRGVPVFDRDGTVIGGVSMSTLVFELSLEEATALAPWLKSAAGQVSAA